MEAGIRAKVALPLSLKYRKGLLCVWSCFCRVKYVFILWCVVVVLDYNTKAVMNRGLNMMWGLFHLPLEEL